MQMPTPLSMSMPRPRTRPRTRPRARPMTSQGQGQGHCLRDINTQLSPFCIFSIFLVFLKRLVFCVVSVILRVRCYLHLRWHYWPHSGWFQISGVSRKVSFEVWDPTQGVLGFQGLVQTQFLVASWKFKCWGFLDPPSKACLAASVPILMIMNSWSNVLRERCKKKRKKKLTSVSFMYVCVAGNGEMLVFFSFFSPTIV